MSVFGNWYCIDCERWIVTGTVAPYGVMFRHCKTARHKKNEAKRAARLMAEILNTTPPDARGERDEK